MSAEGLFVGLPGEFAPPEKTASRIAALDTVAEREALWLRIPEGWRPMIGVMARVAIATRIADHMPELEQRRAAVEQVPEIWRAEVRGLVLSYWKTRHLRAEYLAERTVKRRHDG